MEKWHWYNSEVLMQILRNFPNPIRIGVVLLSWSNALQKFGDSWTWVKTISGTKDCKSSFSWFFWNLHAFPDTFSRHDYPGCLTVSSPPETPRAPPDQGAISWDEGLKVDSSFWEFLGFLPEASTQQKRMDSTSRGHFHQKIMSGWRVF